MSYAEKRALGAVARRGAPAPGPGRPWLTWRGNGRPPAATEQHAAARFWAGQGLPVCRLIARDKRPTDRAPRTTGAGPQHRLATTDPELIDRWWLERHPRWGPRIDCNPGLPTGPWPGFVALDVDRPQAFRAWVGGRVLPATLRWSSGRPDHPERYTLLLRYPAVDFVIRSVVDGRPGCVPGVDLRAAGQHVVLPGAVHPQGSVYTIQGEGPIADPPRWLVDELRDRARATASEERPRARPRVLSLGPAAPAPEAYRCALRIFERAAAGARVERGHRHRTLVGLAWEGLARGLVGGDVKRVLLVRYVDRACPRADDRARAVHQLDQALARPRQAAPNEPRFSVEGQARWLTRRARARRIDAAAR